MLSVDNGIVGAAIGLRGCDRMESCRAWWGDRLPKIRELKD
jgi:hypothetical protein